jgi:hypothetical protein
MKAFAQRSTRWQNDTNVDYRLASSHYFAKRS